MEYSNRRYRFMCFTVELPIRNDVVWSIGLEGIKSLRGLERCKIPYNTVHGANMGPTRVLSAPDGPHVGPMNLAIREAMWSGLHGVTCVILCGVRRVMVALPRSTCQSYRFQPNSPGLTCDLYKHSPMWSMHAEIVAMALYGKTEIFHPQKVANN